MTEEQKEHISQNSKKVANDGRNTVYLYDLKEEKEYTFTSVQAAADYFQVNRNGLVAALRRENGIAYNRFTLSRVKENLVKDIVITCHNRGQFEIKYTIEEYKKIKEEHPSSSAEELAQIMHVCKKTIYNYEHLIDNPTFVLKEEIKYKIINTYTKEEYVVNADEGAKIFGIKNFRKLVKYCETHNSLYKKLFKLIRLNNEI